MARLFREGYMFDFFQAVRLLESMFGKGVGEASDLSEERIRFRPHPGLAFPATDVRSVEIEGGKAGRAVVIAAFMGLYGVDSPLPVYFYDAIATEKEEARPLRDFLDIFNHRLYALFYRSWKKYRAPLQYGRPGTREDFIERALSLAGLGTAGATEGAPLLPVRLASFAGSLSMRVRNAEGLQNLLSEMLGGIQVGVIENILRWVKIPGRSRLGRGGRGAGAVVGQTACIGQEVRDVSGKFRLVLGPLRLDQYLALLPGGTQAPTLRYLVRLYARDTLEYDTELRLRTKDIPLFRLSDRAMKLGQTTWLGRPARETTSRIVAHA